MAETKEFDVVRVARSDGVDIGPGYWPSMNAASKKAGKEPALAEKTVRAKPQMIRLPEDDVRFVEWRVKLGILLKQELAPNPDEGNPWYVQFPRGYWLYEKSKHLWVSGYPIKAKLFKSPQEFGVHLIWLLSASKDYKDCCCVHCNLPNPAKLAGAIDDTLIITHSETPVPVPMVRTASSTSTSMAGTAVPHKVTPVPLPPIPGQKANPPPPPSSSTVSSTSAGKSSTATTTAAKSSSKAPTAASSRAPSGTPQPQQASQPLSQPQQQRQQQPQTQTQIQQSPQDQTQAQSQPQLVRWSLQGSLLFRAGELTWYQNGNTWRLGIIATPVSPNNQVTMLPIGHALAPQQPLVKSVTDLRPFHAFSVPPVAVSDLKDKSFDQAPWETLFHGSEPTRREVLALDASKLAASRIDASFSMWCPLNEDPNVDPTPYYGCFFGAERVEIGDCLRIKPVPSDPILSTTSDSLLMGLRYIFTRKDYPGAIWFRGNVYRLAKPETTTPGQQQQQKQEAFVPEDQLPIALRDESQWRNSLKRPLRWVLLKENLIVSEQFVKGRFYPTHWLMPILNAEGFKAAIAQGQVDTQVPYLNNRMDGTGGYVGRKANRMDSLGATISPASRLSLEPAIRETS
ncbi:Transcription-silencing protein Clr2 [Moelleriella libera RCEF 2490]|uniref:Transcription-silencing protein Clr2 n=1 Tax=Moelleriella libera RCEF 2490 TaxID=1081109 RepID=A0A167Z5H9_9HYPO|nr:Transcription-silencing protein Clr2 [Moelleriella libera RCEF 2490]